MVADIFVRFPVTASNNTYDINGITRRPPIPIIGFSCLASYACALSNSFNSLIDSTPSPLLPSASLSNVLSDCDCTLLPTDGSHPQRFHCTDHSLNHLSKKVIHSENVKMWITFELSTELSSILISFLGLAALAIVLSPFHYHFPLYQYLHLIDASSNLSKLKHFLQLGSEI